MCAHTWSTLYSHTVVSTPVLEGLSVQLACMCVDLTVVPIACTQGKQCKGRGKFFCLKIIYISGITVPSLRIS